MIIFDSTFLIALLHPSPPPPEDRDGRPVEKFRERIEELINTTNAADTLVGVPTPVIAEILVRYPQNKDDYINTLRNRYRFDIVPFGIKAAIEASELIAQLKSENRSQPLEQWAKVKFDIQITAIAKAERATMLYADDKKIENYAKRIKQPVMRICDLPIPAESTPQPPAVANDVGQTSLFDKEHVVPKAADSSERS